VGLLGAEKSLFSYGGEVMNTYIKPNLIIFAVLAIFFLSLGFSCFSGGDINHSNNPSDDDDSSDDDLSDDDMRDDDDITDDDDDDDDNDDDDDDDDDSLGSLDQAISLLILEQMEAGPAGKMAVGYLIHSPLSEGDYVFPGDDFLSKMAVSIGEQRYFSFIDQEPRAFFGHDASFVFLHPEKNLVEVAAAKWWPSLGWLGDKDIWQSEYDEDISITRIYKVVPLEEAVDGPWKPYWKRGSKSPPILGDYGDAPDDAPAYWEVTGRFPSKSATTNSRYGLSGARILIPGQETIGEAVSAERGIEDLLDPDGTENYWDRDLDDDAYVILNADDSEASFSLFFKVSVKSKAPDVPRYINMAADLDKSGHWIGTLKTEEWVVKNLEIDIKPGQSKWIKVGPFDLPSLDGEFNAPIWVRTLLTRELLDEAFYNIDGWDGSGQWDYGEVEDWYVRFRPWSGDSYNGNGLKPQGPPIAPPPSPAQVSCDEVCMSLGLPVGCSYHALVMSGGDHMGQTMVNDAHNLMVDLFEGWFGQSQVESLPNATRVQMQTAVGNLANKVKCYDYVFIYIVGHGLAPSMANPAGGLWLSNDALNVTPGEMKIVLDAISQCPGSQNYWQGDCTAPFTNCDTTVILESSYAGAFFADLQRDGRQIMVSSSSSQISYSGADDTGGELSDKLAIGISTGDADGNGDNYITSQEAFDYAMANIKPVCPQTPEFVNQSNCDCQCDLWAWQGADPGDDLIDWWTGNPANGYASYIDILAYGGAQVAQGVEFFIETSASLPENGAVLGVELDFLLLVDSDGIPGNNDPDHAIYQGADLLYQVHWNSVSHIWEMYKSRYNPTLSSWGFPSATISDFQINGNTLVFIIDPDEESLPGETNIDFKLVDIFWGDMETFGDDTSWEIFRVDPLPAKCGRGN